VRRVLRHRCRLLVLSVGVLLLPAGGAGAEPASPSQTCFSPNCPITINDNTSTFAIQDQPATPYPSQISFPHGDPCCGVIDRVVVHLTGLTHASLADVDVLLVRRDPQGQAVGVVELMSDVGVGGAAANLNLTFDDSAAALPATGPVSSGTYRPTNHAGTGPQCAADSPPTIGNADPLPPPAPAAPTGGYGQSLGVFGGTYLSNETWHLYVGDDCTGGAGSISSWSLEFFLRNGPDLLLFKTADDASVAAGSPIGFGIDAFDGPEGSFFLSLYDQLPAGPGIDWSISPPYSGPGSCSISGSAGSETLSCEFGPFPGFGASVHVSSATSSLSCGTYTNYAVLSSDHYPPSGATASATVNCSTAVTVSSFAAIPSARGVLVRWRTGSDAGVLGFNVYREQNGRRLRLNRALIARRTDGGHAYSWLDRSAPRQGQVRHWLQAVSRNGARNWYGPQPAR
jgi:hypothetical protein